MSTGKVRVCKTCESDITSVTGERCPICNTKLKIATNKLYATPDYLSYQKDSLLKELDLDKLKPGDSKYDERHAAICNEQVRWARECPDEDKVAAFMDAAILLKELIHSDTSPHAQQTIVKIAKGIGNLAQKIESYLEAGGSLYDREIRPISPEYRDPDGGTSATGTGRGPYGGDAIG